MQQKKSKKKKRQQQQQKIGVTSAIVTPQRQDQVWPNSLAMPLVKLRTAGVVKPKNCMSKINIHTEMGLFVGLSQPKTMSELTKPPSMKTTAKKKKTKIIFSQKRAHMFCH